MAVPVPYSFLHWYFSWPRRSRQRSATVWLESCSICTAHRHECTMHTYIHTHIHTYIYTYIHTYMHTCTCTHTCTHTHTCTYAHSRLNKHLGITILLESHYCYKCQVNLDHLNTAELDKDTHPCGSSGCIGVAKYRCTLTLKTCLLC